MTLSLYFVSNLEFTIYFKKPYSAWNPIKAVPIYLHIKQKNIINIYKYFNGDTLSTALEKFIR